MVIENSSKRAKPLLDSLLVVFTEHATNPMQLKTNREDYNRFREIMTKKGMNGDDFDGCMRWIFEVTVFNLNLGDELRRKSMNSW